MISPVEERVWAYLVKNPTADADEVAINCDVTEEFAQYCIDRIGTPREVLLAETAAPMEGRKDDGDKAPYHLLAPEMLEATALVLGFGAKKYSARNWEKGMHWSRPFGALMRHMWAWWRGWWFGVWIVPRHHRNADRGLRYQSVERHYDVAVRDHRSSFGYRHSSCSSSCSSSSSSPEPRSSSSLPS